MGVYSGEKQPADVREFLADTIEEVGKTQKNEIQFDSSQNIKQIQLEAITYSHPARSFVKNKKSHSGYHSWENVHIGA